VGKQADRAGAVPSAGEDEPVPGLPAADSGIRYLERCCEFPVAGGPIGVGLLAASLVGARLVPNRGLALDVLRLVAVIPALYLFVVLLGLPYGIEIAAGRFAVGARGAALPTGPMWRRITGSLEAVASWDMLTARQARLIRRERRGRLRSGRRLTDLGDMHLFSQRGYLRLRVDPDLVAAYFSSRPTRHPVFVRGWRGTAIWDGAVVIGTRRPAALASALERALPGRRSLITVPTDDPDG
jgi:hypothetical protein